ncbi:hypothetical protein Hanom_Chr09g00849081 [Helianthus anomalus]
MDSHLHLQGIRFRVPIGIMTCEIMGNLLYLVQVDQSTDSIKENFGKFDDALEPGCIACHGYLKSAC